MVVIIPRCMGFIPKFCCQAEGQGQSAIRQAATKNRTRSPSNTGARWIAISSIRPPVMRAVCDVLVASSRCLVQRGQTVVVLGIDLGCCIHYVRVRCLW